ncbi:hypothetical protein RRG08_058316 [Elysia crispata]|uniref:G-protein coupled receptors family 1 profile domain-containing protein n=1 Tax=Elysia crispata TaxID=231223 RepID=A0AAE1D5E8_9GAST|nr:hypothetical protein RRG08_058316 [Elysia crispata]
MTYEIKRVLLTVDKVTTIYTELHTKSLQQIGRLWFISYSLPTALCFTTITVGTLLLVIKLRQTVVVRSSMAPGSRSSVDTNRETKIVRVVIIISTIYICCLSPSVSFYATSFGIPRLAHIDHRFDDAVCVLLC